MGIWLLSVALGAECADPSPLLDEATTAVLEGRYHVDFADIRALAHPVLRHRLVLNFHGRSDNVDSDHVIDSLLASVKEESA